MDAGCVASGEFARDRANLAAIEPDVAQRTGVEPGERAMGFPLAAMAPVVGEQLTQVRGESARRPGDRRADGARTLRACRGMQRHSGKVRVRAGALDGDVAEAVGGQRS